MACAVLLAACWMLSLGLGPGVGFADLFDEMDERLIADALVFAPII